MRSEKEIRDKIAYIQTLIDDEIKHTDKMIKDEGMGDFVNSAMERINIYQSVQYYLRWALGDVD